METGLLCGVWGGIGQLGCGVVWKLGCYVGYGMVSGNWAVCKVWCGMETGLLYGVWGGIRQLGCM